MALTRISIVLFPFVLSNSFALATLVPNEPTRWVQQVTPNQGPTNIILEDGFASVRSSSSFPVGTTDAVLFEWSYASIGSTTVGYAISGTTQTASPNDVIDVRNTSSVTLNKRAGRTILGSIDSGFVEKSTRPNDTNASSFLKAGTFELSDGQNFAATLRTSAQWASSSAQMVFWEEDSDPYCNPEETIQNVVLPEIEFNIGRVAKDIEIDMVFEETRLDFDVEEPIGGAICSAHTRGSLPVNLSIAGFEFQAFSTTEATVSLRDNTVVWNNTGFTVTALSPDGVILPVPFGGQPMQVEVSLLDLGLPPQTPFDAVVRVAEDYIHRSLSEELFGSWRDFLVFADPGVTELLVTAPDGKQTGKPNGSEIVLDIPGSIYVQTQSGPAVVMLLPSSGNYEIEMYGLESGDVELVSSSVQDGSVVTTQSLGLNIVKGETLKFVAEFESSSGTIHTQEVPEPSALLLSVCATLVAHSRRSREAV